MANPFLVLGGIAVGIITASFGVLQVPGWVASAQDASAINDLRMISEAQAASASLKGEYAGEIATLQGGGLGLSFAVPDERVKHFAADGDGWCSVTLSDSGRYFGVSDTLSEAKSAATLEEAVATACGTDASPGDGTPDPDPEEPAPTPELPPATVVAATFTTGAFVADMEFSPDSRTAYISHLNASYLSVIDVGTRAIKKIPTPPSAYGPQKIALSPDGSLLALGSTGANSTGSTVIYNTKDMSVATTLATRGIKELTWNAGGDTLVVAESRGFSSQINFWNTSTWMPSAKPVDMLSCGTRVEVTATQDNRVLVGCGDIYVVDPTAATSKLVYDHTSQGAWNTVATDDVWWVARAGGSLVKLDPAKFTVLTDELVAQNRASRDLAASADRRWLYHVGAGEVNVFDIDAGKVVAQIAVPSTSAKASASPDGTQVYIGHGDAAGTVTVLAPTVN